MRSSLSLKSIIFLSEWCDPMELQIRPAVLEDSCAIARISSDELGYDCSSEFVRKKLSGLDLSREAVFVAQSDDCVIGYIHIEKYDTLYFDTLANVLGLAVMESCQRKGAGRQLIDAAEKWAVSIGAAGIRLNSGSTRTDAHKFYRAVGFISEKQQLNFRKSF